MKRILVVEDTECVRNALALQLGFLFPDTEVVMTVSADEGIREISKPLPFDLILTDLDNPSRDGGFKVIKASKELHPETPVILMTGRVEEDIEQLALGHGADGFLNKPFSLQKFRDLVDRLCTKVQAAA